MRQQRQSAMSLFAYLVALVAVGSSLSVATAFIVPLAPPPTFQWKQTGITSRMYSTSASEESSTDTSSLDSMFSDATILEFTLEEHKPLGCTVEESLAHPMEKHVFITKLVDTGFAKAAGLLVGDVLVSIPGIFGDETSVFGMGINQVKSLVSGRNEEEPLQLRIARGTNVMEDHENALVELCMTPGGNDDQVEECVTAIMAGTYLDDNDNDEMNKDEMTMECDEEGECLLDSLYEMWEEDMPTPVNTSDDMDTDESSNNEEETIAPWSSRSSPSGTYQLDPATGEMKRTDS